MNRQVDPDHCYDTDEGYVHARARARHARMARPEGRAQLRTFTSLVAAKGWLEYFLDHPAIRQEAGMNYEMTGEDVGAASHALLGWRESQDINPQDAARVLTTCLVAVIHKSP